MDTKKNPESQVFGTDAEPDEGTFLEQGAMLVSKDSRSCELLEGSEPTFAIYLGESSCESCSTLFFVVRLWNENAGSLPGSSQDISYCHLNLFNAMSFEECPPMPHHPIAGVIIPSICNNLVSLQLVQVALGCSQWTN